MLTLNNWLENIEKVSSRPTIDLGLDCIKKALHALGLLPFPHKVITVAGTNGKGSTVAILESLLLAHGYHTASFTSPHIIHYNERMKLSGESLPDEVIVKAFSAISSVAREYNLTYFEWTTLCALYVFYHQPLDYVILEVGLGGRLDAVNSIDSDVAIITSISFDHQSFLGNTLEDIAKEKAGIMRPHKPVIIGDRNPSRILIDIATRLGSPIIVCARDIKVSQKEAQWSYRSLTHEYHDLPLPSLLLDNAISAIAALEALSIPLDRVSISRGLKASFVSGRQEWKENEKLLLDVAHNQASISMLIPVIARLNKPIKLCFAMRFDKDYELCLTMLLPYIHKAYVSFLTSDKDEIDDMRAFYKRFDKVCCFDTVDKAYQALIVEKDDDEIILVTGSFQTVGIVKQLRYNAKVNKNKRSVVC